MTDMIKCNYCLKEFSKYGIKQHINIVHLGKIEQVSHKGSGNRGGWNRGLTKETNELVNIISKKTKDTLIKNYKNGNIIAFKHTPESKSNLRDHAIKNKLGGLTSRKNIIFKRSNGEVVKLHSKFEEKVAIELDFFDVKWNRPKNGLIWHDKNENKHRYYADFYLTDYDVYLDPKNDYLIKKDKFKIDKVTKENLVRILILNSNELSWKSILSKIEQ